MVSVLVAGIGGGSLGTEVLKALHLAGDYRIFGCDVSPLAFGHYAEFCEATALASANDYIDSLLDICRRYDVEVVVPGAEEPTKLIASAAEKFEHAGIRLAMNAPDVVAKVNDKRRCFLELERLGFAIPRTIDASYAAALAEMAYPCVIKPSVDSGGSSFVFFARDRKEAELYAAYLRASDREPVAQEYVSHDNGEFTVGVLSGQDGLVVGAIAMRRSFPTKLSVMAKGRDFLISSGVSQGRFDEFPDICKSAREIAFALKSVGPLNIQGRVDGRGRFLPFEINPRFSASTYLRALAGFNEVDYFVKSLVQLQTKPLAVRAGWYLRGLSEAVVSDNRVIS